MINAQLKPRDDVLVYTTPAFPQDTEVTGPVSLELFAQSSAVDTDFLGKLVDVRANGFAQNLTEGIIRARYRNSQETPELMNPGQVYKFVLSALRPEHEYMLADVKATDFFRPTQICDDSV